MEEVNCLRKENNWRENQPIYLGSRSSYLEGKSTKSYRFRKLTIWREITQINWVEESNSRGMFGTELSFYLLLVHPGSPLTIVGQSRIIRIIARQLSFLFKYIDDEDFERNIVRIIILINESLSKIIIKTKARVQ